MFNLERAIKDWKRGLARNPSLEDGAIAELEAAMRDELCDLVRKGCSEEEAFNKVAADMGTADGAGAEFHKVYTTRLFSRPSWRPPRFMPDLAWNYLTIASRKIRRHAFYSLINIFGLGVGIACCLVIFLYVADEMSFDDYHRDLDRIYRLAVISEAPTATVASANVCAPSAAALRDHFPQVETVARILQVEAGLMERGDRKFYEDTRIFADPELFDILTIPFLKGNPRHALERPGTMVITARMAQKYFGDEEPLGKTICVNARDHEITGVVADPPHNTHLNYDCFVSMKTLEGRYPFEEWFLTNLYVYAKLRPGVRLADVAERVSRIADDYAPKEKMNPGETIRYSLQPVRDIHLHSHLRAEPTPSGDPLSLYLFSAVGLFVLLIACMNFINLTTAQSIKLAKEAGVRKAMGAERRQLVGQFLGEASVVVLCALVLAVFLVIVSLPLVNAVSGKAFDSSVLLRSSILVFMAGLGVFAAVAAGAYPAIALSGLEPARALKERRNGSGANSLRMVLVVSQFAISVAVMVGTLTVYHQTDFMKNRVLGFERKQKLVIPIRGNLSIKENYETVKKAFLQNPSVTGASVSSHVPGMKLDRWDTTWTDGGDGRVRTLNHLYVDPDFLDAYGIRLVAGRAFNREMSTDVDGTFILNRLAAAEYGWTPEEAVGKHLESIFPGVVIGVTEDFNYKGLQSAIEPVALAWRPGRFHCITLNVRGERLPETMASVERQWAKLFPGNPFDSFFLDAYFDRQYQSEEKVGRMLSVFTLVGFVISCLGLFGLTSYTVEQRTKEIGVRKVLGASESRLTALLSAEFLKYVLLANAIALPAAYFLMARLWLSKFAYRADPDPWIFGLVVATSLSLALLTVVVQSARAAHRNPVDALRYE